jgi:hypothetical protein
VSRTATKWLNLHRSKNWVVAHAVTARDFLPLCLNTSNARRLFLQIPRRRQSYLSNTTPIRTSFSSTSVDQSSRVTMSYADVAAKGPKQPPEEVSLQAPLHLSRMMTDRWCPTGVSSDSVPISFVGISLSYSLIVEHHLCQR